MKKEGITVTLSPAKSEEYFYNALCNAVGSGYMSGYSLELKANDQDYAESRKKLNNPCLEDVWMQMLRDGKTLTMIDHESGEDDKTISLSDVHERVSKTPLRHLSDMMSGNNDAETADAIIQTVFYEDIIFG